VHFQTDRELCARRAQRTQIYVTGTLALPKSNTKENANEHYKNTCTTYQAALQFSPRFAATITASELFVNTERGHGNDDGSCDAGSAATFRVAPGGGSASPRNFGSRNSWPVVVLGSEVAY
jgi:hypothetical protein